MDFNPSGSAASKYDIFDRNNTTIQNSNTSADYDSLSPYSYATSVVTQKGFSDFYNNGYMGKVYVMDGREEILVYATDRTTTNDESALEYVNKDKYVTDGASGNILVNSKYNLLDL